MGCGAAPNLFYGVSGRFEKDDVQLAEENAGQQPEAGWQYGDDFHSWNKLSVSTEVCRDKWDPDNEEYKHAKSDELGFCEVFWKFSWLECKEETYSSQEASIANKKAKRHHWTFIARDKNDLIDVIVLVARRRGIVKPHHADHNLDKRAQKHQKKLQI